MDSETWRVVTILVLHIGSTEHLGLSGMDICWQFSEESENIVLKQIFPNGLCYIS